MSHARCRLRGTTYGVAIRCSERRFFLAPTAETNLTLRFLLAFYAAKHGIELHGYAFLSNHYHLVLTDTRGALGAFMRDFDSRVAKVINARLGRSEALFSRDGYEAWELETDDVIGHLVYVALNPVEAGLVRDPAAWPGLLSLPEGCLAPPRRVRQPPRGFYGSGPSKAYPAQVDLVLSPPPGFLSPEAFVRSFRGALDLALPAALAAADPGKVWPPRASLAKVDPFSCPPGGTRPDFQVRPHLPREASLERKLGLKAWREAYAHALYAWRAGVREVVFPPGTYLMRRLHRVQVAPDR